MSKSENLIIWGRRRSEWLLAARCGMCGGRGQVAKSDLEYVDCQHCAGLGWFGIDPRMPLMALQGSTAKIAMLSVRYAMGVPLFDDRDYKDPELSSHRDVEQRTSVAPAANSSTPESVTDIAGVQRHSLSLLT